MRLLYSQIPPMRRHEGQETFLDAFRRAAGEADRLVIGVGYASQASLVELGRLADELGLQEVRLILGMYCVEGMPESTYHAAVELAEQLAAAGRGTVELVQPFKYHGKLYVFYHGGQPFCAFVGSHNLGALRLDANNRRQYEVSAETREPGEVAEVAAFLDDLARFARPIGEVHVPLIREHNASLTGIEYVSEVPDRSVVLYQQHQVGTRFVLPLKVPHAAERFLDDNRHYTKSNINVCYAAPRSHRKSRDWYETQMTVSVEVRRQPGYPEKNHPFFVVTDDGYWFKAHTTSDKNKQFNAVNDDLILGRWLKGRLAAAGLVEPVNDTQADTERRGMITREMLDAYGADTLIFQRTDQRAANPEKKNEDEPDELDVWTLSFAPHEEGEA